MRLTLWQQFSSNHSARFTVVGQGEVVAHVLTPNASRFSHKTNGFNNLPVIGTAA